MVSVIKHRREIARTGRHASVQKKKYSWQKIRSYIDLSKHYPASRTDSRSVAKLIFYNRGQRGRSMTREFWIQPYKSNRYEFGGFRL